MTEIRKVTASDINSALAGRYSGDDWRIWFEVSEGTGAIPGRRADAVALNIWPSKGYQLNVFEVKVSRADFMAELKNLTKSEAIGKYADFFWLVTPVGLVKQSEVPQGWGLMELTRGGLRIKKQAPARDNPKPLDRAFAASMLRAGQDLGLAEIDRRVSEQVDGIRADIEARIRTKLESEVTKAKLRDDAWTRWKVKFEKVYGLRPSAYLDPEKAAERVRAADLLTPERLRSIKSLVQSLQSALESLEATTDD